MKFDIGMLALIAAVLIFYLRLIVIQRERTKRLRRLAAAQQLKEPRKPPKKGAAPSKASEKKNTPPSSAAAERYSIFSTRRGDWIIAGVGIVLIAFALLLYSGALRLPGVQPYAWIPTALGIVMFSWAFQL